MHVYRANSRLHVHYAQHPNRLWLARARRAERVWVGDVTYVRVAAVSRTLQLPAMTKTRSLPATSGGPNDTPRIWPWEPPSLGGRDVAFRD